MFLTSPAGAGEVAVQSTEGEGDRVAPLFEDAACRPDHPHPALRAASIRFAAQPREAGDVIVIAAGGTGGHFFPAEALASELLARGRRIALLTDARSAGLHSAVFAGQEHYVVRGAGIAGRGALRAAQAAVALAAGTLQARGILARLGAAAVVGFGGYPCVAPVLSARLMRRRPAVILHEQNAVLGRANRFLARHADALALSFADTTRVPEAAATVVTGNPVRPAIAALAETAYAPPGDTVNLLVLGGSLGARVFSDVVPPALATLPERLRARLAVVQQCRPEDLDRVRAAYAQAGIAAELAIFFADMADRLTRAHLVIARAGASTVAELAVAGRPSILVPLPGAIDDHQSANARALSDARGASVIAQPDFSPAALAERLTLLMAAPDMLAHAALAARRVARPDATARLADLVEDLMRGANSSPSPGGLEPRSGSRLGGGGRAPQTPPPNLDPLRGSSPPGEGEPKARKART
jgi:UDP-N-acetylglucosamine--N-acetylmuramyl-(pentapeptide) pyrophosphoryl-undecaprenol N-acetylglucosamine transferase